MKQSLKIPYGQRPSWCGWLAAAVLGMACLTAAVEAAAQTAREPRQNAPPAAHGEPGLDLSWQMIAGLAAGGVFFGATILSVASHGSRGWGWAFWTFAFGVLAMLARSRRRRSSWSSSHFCGFHFGGRGSPGGSSGGSWGGSSSGGGFSSFGGGSFGGGSSGGSW